MTRLTRTPGGAYRLRRSGHSALITEGANTISGRGKYRHAHITPPGADRMIELRDYRTLRDIKRDAIAVIDALASAGR